MNARLPGSEARRLQVAARLRLLALRAGPLYQRTRSLENVARFFLRRPHERDFAFFAQCADQTGLFLDVGANAGMSAVSFRIFNKQAPILSLEPNPAHRRDLSFVGRLVKPYEFRLIGAGDEEGFATLYVPSYRSIPITPLATFERQLIDSDWRLDILFGSAVRRQDIIIEELRVPVHPIDDLDVAPAVVKIDVEGFEAAVIRGMQQTLADHRPLLLLEWSRQFGEVEKLLRGHDYVTSVFDPSTEKLLRFDGSNKSLNMFCLPAEHRLAPASSSSTGAVREG
jgi:FkbM family methyltransferase